MHIYKGYSLVELVIVVGLVSVLSITISAIVLTTIVNGTRLRNEVRIRQTGDYAVGQIETIIRNSLKVTACNSATNTVTISGPDHLATTISLSATQIASSSAATQYLTPTDTVTTLFDINCLPTDTDPSLINISFTLGKVGGASLKTIENVTENFSTSVQVRNF